MGRRGLAVMGGNTKSKLTLRKGHCFVIEEYVEDVKQDEKHVPDLPESIMRPTFFVNVELRPILFKMIELRPEINHKNHGLTQKSEVPNSCFL